VQTANRHPKIGVKNCEAIIEPIENICAGIKIYTPQALQGRHLLAMGNAHRKDVAYTL